ncbi:hypothetical protein PFLuk1_05360 [Pseudomonas fluorescens]|nr:hypothetical protein PFLuk1_05360 [Pseudomonas fluorescens]WHT76728.1 hypothetical protein QMY54_01475 [Pseudomonas rhodesiae]
MYLLQMSRSESDFLSMAGYVPMACRGLYQIGLEACCQYWRVRLTRSVVTPESVRF